MELFNDGSEESGDGIREGNRGCRSRRSNQKIDGGAWASRRELAEPAPMMQLLPRVGPAYLNLDQNPIYLRRATPT